MVKPDFKIHTSSHLIKSTLGFLEFLFYPPKYNNEELIVVNYHGTPDKFFTNFKKQVAFLTRSFKPLKATEIASYFNTELSAEKPHILFTFDDGLKNNLKAARYLAEQGISAFFFLVPSFIECPEDLQSDYYKTNIRPIINPFIESGEKDTKALSLEDIQEIIALGHCIGCHTHTHRLVATESTIENSIFEIIVSKKLLESKLNISISSFCSINNTLLSISKKEKELLSENYKYHFTTIPGYNEQKNPLFIKRRNIESFWLPGAVKLAVGKFDLKRWEKYILKYNSL